MRTTNADITAKRDEIAKFGRMLSGVIGERSDLTKIARDAAERRERRDYAKTEGKERKGNSK